MAYTLRAGLHFCEVGGRFIFLDLDADRYFCLGLRAESAVRALRDPSTPAGSAVPNAAILSDVGLIETGDGIGLQPCAAPAIPTESALDAEAVACPIEECLGAVSRLLVAKAGLRFRGLGRAIRTYANHKTRVAKGNDPRSSLLIDVAAFERTARWMRSHDQCLPRSLALGRALLRRGHPVDLIIGVRLRPFAAHCWVQTPELLLNDRFEHVRTYQPILVV